MLFGLEPPAWTLAGYTICVVLLILLLAIKN